MSSFFKKVFGAPGGSTPKGSAKNETATKTISAIENLVIKEEQLEKRRQVLEERVSQELEKARDFTRKNKKSQALICLKKKKMYEQQMTNLSNLILKINEQRIVLENSQTTAETVNAMKAATDVSKETMKANKIEKIDDLLEDIQEVNDNMREVQERLGEPTGIFADMDEDELLKELEDMEATELDNELLEPVKVKPVKKQEEKLPSVPKNKVKQKNIDDELKDLEAELNMA